MNFKFLSFVFTLSELFRYFVSSHSASISNLTIESLTYLGNFEGKDYYGGQTINDWFGAHQECLDAGLKLVRLDSAAEVTYLIGESQILPNHGPFWLGARDIGRPEMYRWVEPTDVYRPPSPEAESIDDWIDFYYSVEDGPMALTLNDAYGSYVVGVHSHKIRAKAFCQH